MKDPFEPVRKMLEGRNQSMGHVYHSLIGKDGHVHKFETLTAAGVKPEGAADTPNDSPEDAVEAYKKQLEKYLAKDSSHEDAVIYWRCEPAIEQHKHQFYIWSRLLVGPPGLKDPK